MAVSVSMGGRCGPDHLHCHLIKINRTEGGNPWRVTKKLHAYRCARRKQALLLRDQQHDGSVFSVWRKPASEFARWREWLQRICACVVEIEGHFDSTSLRKLQGGIEDQRPRQTHTKVA